MIDPVAVSVDAILHNDAARLPLVAAAGALTSFGPCVAPRYIAIAALLGDERRALTVVTFVGGMLTAYAALGFGAGVLGQLASRTSAIYLVLAAALAVAGFMTLLRSARCGHDDHRSPAAAPHSRRLSAVFSLGAGSAFVVSPCCTPIVAAVAGMTVLDAHPFSRAAFLAAFALGHAMPVFAAGALGSLSARTLRRWNASPAPAVVSGSLLLALAGYYGLLA